MKYIITLFFAAVFSVWGQEQDKEVTLTVSGTGQTQNDAKEKALRNAIEQAFGAFISSRTEILNDEIISDQITSLTSGNIKSYEILNEAQIPNGGYATTVKATLSVSKLTSFVESKGITVEIKGSLFALNVKQQILNEQAEFKILYDVVSLLHEIIQQSFDYEITSQSPRSIDGNEKFEIPLIITVKSNKNMVFCSDYLLSVLNSISMTVSEVESYRLVNKSIYELKINSNDSTFHFYLREKSSLNVLRVLSDKWPIYSNCYTMKNGIEELSGVGKGDLFQFTKQSNNSTLELNFPSLGIVVSTKKYYDIKSLDQIEKITKYTISPSEPISKIKHGGFIVWEENGHGLVSTICDLGICSYDRAETITNVMNLLSFNDWRLPSKEELNKMRTSNGAWYWTNYKNILWQWPDSYPTYIENECNLDHCKGILFPVREF